MGTHYSYGLGIGYVVKVKEALAPFAKVTPEVSHEEKRFDAKTGRSLSPVKVIDKHGYTEYTIGGTTIDNVYDAEDMLSKFLNVKIARIGAEADIGGPASAKEDKFIFCVNDPYDGSALHPSGTTTVHHAEIPAMWDFRPELAQLRERLVQVGIRPGNEPVIRIFISYC